LEIDPPTTGELRDLERFQFRRKLAIGVGAVLATVALLFCSSLWRNEARTDLLIRHIGAALILASIAGRTWCAIYIGGKKKNTLVQDGPYSLVRHPLYVFSVLGALGVGAQWGAILVSLVLACVTMVILNEAVRKEEAFMSLVFGQAYAYYSERVPRFLPRFATWRDVDELTVKPVVVVRTFRDSCLFLVAIPIAQTIDWAQQVGYLPILLRLP
jgi:protein-S-isoprenylcysteine O-methyltransferase Ste14